MEYATAWSSAGALLILLSVLMFLWGCLGLINPRWARLQDRLRAVAVWVVSVVLLAGAAAMMYFFDTDREVADIPRPPGSPGMVWRVSSHDIAPSYPYQSTGMRVCWRIQ